jgi:hypothetical protein
MRLFAFWRYIYCNIIAWLICEAEMGFIFQVFFVAFIAIWVIWGIWQAVIFIACMAALIGFGVYLLGRDTKLNNKSESSLNVRSEPKSRSATNTASSTSNSDGDTYGLMLGSQPKDLTGFKVNAQLKIKYVDSDGNSSERIIHVLRYEDSSPGVMVANCLKAKARRSFRTDRVSEAIDIDTGELIKKLPTFMRSKRVME